VAEDLLGKQCVPCEGGVDPLRGATLAPYRDQLPKKWEVVDEHHLLATYRFDDFASALSFVNCAGDVAEAEGHHPEMTVTWGRVDVKVWTHAIDGLSENDFILAAKIDHRCGGTAA